jgi:hypothetical protein
MCGDTIQYLVLDRFDPACNMARYYVLAIEPSLVRRGLSFMKPSQRPWKLSRLGSNESADVATRSEMDRRMAVTDAVVCAIPNAEVEGAEG